MADKYVENFKIGNTSIKVKDPEAMPKSGGAFTGSIAAPSFSGSVDADNVSADSVSANTVTANTVRGTSGSFVNGSDKQHVTKSDGIADAFNQVENDNGKISLLVSQNRGIFDSSISDWMLYRGYYEGAESMRSTSAALFLRGKPIHPMIDSDWINILPSYFRYRIIDRRVFLSYINRTNQTIPHGVWTTIATLSPRVRPSLAYYGLGFEASSNNLLHVYVGTDGTVQLFNPSDHDYVNCSFSAEYPVGPESNHIYTLSYNIGEWAEGVGHGMSETDYQNKIAGISRFFNSLSADIMFFQEYRNYLDQNNTHSAADVLFPNTIYPGKHAATLNNLTVQIISKTNVSGGASGKLTANSIAPYAICFTTVGGKSITLMCVHLHPTDATIRNAEITQLLSIANSYPNMIIGGDFNFSSANDEYINQFWKFVTAGFSIANGGLAGWLGTWPKITTGSTPARSWFIDNIIVKGCMEIGGVNVPAQAGEIVPSDHLPIWAYLGMY